ncbi:MAG: histidine kinase [Bacteroidia bacterium]|nr:histidine kinase [Bacteroidia bacterium]
MTKQQKPTLVLHLSAFFLFFTFLLIYWEDHSFAPETFKLRHFQSELLSCAILVVIFYINYFVLIPNLYFKRKRLILVLSYLLGFFLMVTSCYLWDPSGRVEYLFFLLAFPFLISITLSSLLRINYYWNSFQSFKNEFAQANFKAQLSPHFWFNSLNSIYALSLSNSEETPDAILMLANLFRYSTQENIPTEVALKEDLDFLESYIHLQRIRVGDTALVEYSRTGPEEELKIIPMLVWTLVDNAFKHGVSPEMESPIKIYLSTSKRVFSLSIKNRKVCNSSAFTKDSSKSSSNLIQVLNLFYPNSHEISIFDNEEFYEVSLKIQL